MLAFVLKRFLSAIPTLFLLMTMTFFLIRLAPGGPFDTDRVWPPEVQANIDAKYGLNLPVYEQYWNWLKDLAHGDLRESFLYLGQPVTKLISESLIPSMQLGGVALLFSILLGIPLGSIAAWKQNSVFDASAMFASIAGVSLPTYLVASILILYFSLHLGWFPPALWEEPSSIVLPAITLGLRPMAVIARLTRSSMIEALQSDYVRTARSKGLSRAKVVFKHALRNSMIPVLTVLGPIAASLVTGSFLVEIVFQIPGTGKHFVQAVLNRDYPMVMGVTLIYGVILISCNLLVDLLYGLIDPRIQIDSMNRRA